MAGRTNSDRIEDLNRQVIVLTRDVEHVIADSRERAELLSRSVADLKRKRDAGDRRLDLLEQGFSYLDSHNTAQIPLLAQRLAQIEKQADENRIRKWQVWLAFIGAFLSILVAIVVSIVKR